MVTLPVTEPVAETTPGMQVRSSAASLTSANSERSNTVSVFDDRPEERVRRSRGRVVRRGSWTLTLTKVSLPLTELST